MKLDVICNKQDEFDKRIAYFKDYNEQKPSLNPPFSSVYICQNVLPKQIVFETIHKE